MALTPEGTPYVESTDLVANYPAASLSLANRVDLVGVLPFATSAARATAIPSPTDGQYSYLQDSNSTEFWNGSAWVAAGVAPGLVIVAPTSIANSGGSASATGGAVTFTGVTSVSLNGVFSATYDYYKILSLNTGSTSAVLNYRLRLSGTDATGANYGRQELYGTGATAGAFRSVNATSGNIGLLYTDQSSFTADIFNPSVADYTHVISTVCGRPNTANADVYVYAGGHSVTTAYDGITLIASSGTMSGKVRVYGYKNS